MAIERIPDHDLLLRWVKATDCLAGHFRMLTCWICFVFRQWTGGNPPESIPSVNTWSSELPNRLI